MYTSMDPVSFSISIASIGSASMPRVTSRSLVEFMRYPYRPMNAASIMDVDIFESSAGWKLTGPKLNQELEPLCSVPRNMTATSSTSITTYTGPAMVSYSRGGMTKSIRAPRPMAPAIQTSCFPLLPAKSYHTVSGL